MAIYSCSEIKPIRIGDKVFELKTEEDKKHLNGYIYDSLMYRYIRAREQMAEYEYEKQNPYLDPNVKHNKEYYQIQANRDIMRFCQILDEAIGEHD